MDKNQVLKNNVMKRILELRTTLLTQRRILASLAFALFLNGCESRPEVQGYLPKRADIVVFFRLDRIVRDKDLSRAINIEEFKKEIKKVDITIEEISQMVVFMELGPKKYAGAILQGNYNAREKIQKLIKKGWHEKRYSKDTYYCNRNSEDCIGLLKTDILIIGSDEAIKDTFDVYKGKERGKTSYPSYIKLAKSINHQNAPVIFYFIPSQTVVDMAQAGLEATKTIFDILNFGIIGGILEKVGIAEGLSMSLDPSGDKFKIEFSSLMQSETAASLISGSLNLLKSMSGFLSSRANMSPQEREAINTFKNMEIIRMDEVIKIEMTVSRRTLFIH